MPMKFLFNSSVLNSRFYKPSTQWTWNMFKVRFWYEWTPVFKSERVMELIYSEYKLPAQGIKKAIENHRNFNPYGLLPKHIDYSKGNARYLEKHGYRLPALNDSTFRISSLTKIEDKAYSASLITNSKQQSDSYGSASISETPLVPTNVDQIKLIPRINGGYDIETFKDPDLKSGDEPMSYMGIVNTTPEYMKLSLFRPTPEHFDLVEFDDVVKAGFDLTNEQVDKKGSQLQICAWVTLIFLMMFSYFTVVAGFKFVIATAVTNQFEYSYLLSSLYLLVLSTLSGVIYLSYVHLYWQYCRNRFGSLYCYFKDVTKNPIRLLPIPFTDPMLEVRNV